MNWKTLQQKALWQRNMPLQKLLVHCTGTCKECVQSAER